MWAKITDDECGGPTKSIDKTTEEDENASMDVMRAFASVSNSGQKVSLSLSSSKHMDDESCAGGWGSIHWHRRSNIFQR